MIARPAVLYVRDVPIMWLPFIFNDIRGAGAADLFPRFGLNDLVRPPAITRGISPISATTMCSTTTSTCSSRQTGFAGRYVAIHGQAQYDWLDRSSMER